MISNARTNKRLIYGFLLVLYTIVAVGSFRYAIYYASLMQAFDTYYDEPNFIAQLVTVILPIVIILATLCAWIYYFMGRYQWIVWALLLPLLCCITTALVTVGT